METILAIGLVMSVIIGSLTIGVYTSRIGRNSKNRLIALYLAQEPIEVLRNMRDSNWLKMEEDTGDVYKWDDGFNFANPCKIGNIQNHWCSFDLEFDRHENIGPEDDTWSWERKIVGSPESCGDGCQIKLDNGEDFGDIGYGFYNHEYGKKTNFYRAIQLDRSETDKITIISKVVWKEGDKVREVKLSETITNWRDTLNE